MRKNVLLLACLVGWGTVWEASAQMSQSFSTGPDTWTQYILGQGGVESVNVSLPVKQVTKTDSKGKTTISTVVDYSPPATAQFVGGPASGQQTLSVRKDFSVNGPESLQVLKDGRVALGYSRAQALSTQNQAVVAIAASSETAGQVDVLQVSTRAGNSPVLKVGSNGQVQVSTLVLPSLAMPVNPGDSCSVAGQLAFTRVSTTVAGVFLGCDGLIWRRLSQ
jgi:hypothetical protein